jgi:hypothetical protein
MEQKQRLRSVQIMFVYGGKKKRGNAEFAVFFILIFAHATLKTVSCNIITSVITWISGLDKLIATTRS